MIDSDDDDTYDDEIEETLAKCPKCGAEVYDDIEQCPHCGDWIGTPEHAGGGHKRTFVTLVAIALLLVIVVYWILG
jgi:uncharacterized OB-fold protein